MDPIVPVAYAQHRTGLIGLDKDHNIVYFDYKRREFSTGLPDPPNWNSWFLYAEKPDWKKILNPDLYRFGPVRPLESD